MHANMAICHPATKAFISMRRHTHLAGHMGSLQLALAQRLLPAWLCLAAEPLHGGGATATAPCVHPAYLAAADDVHSAYDLTLAYEMPGIVAMC